MDTMTFDIRPLEEAEIYRLYDFPFAHIETHRRRFALQEAGKLVFLMAWWQELPVGQVLLNWEGGDASGVPPQWREGPEVSSLFVSPSHRRLGVATQLLTMAEQMSFVHAYNQIGLCVRVDNLPAMTLYGQLGYRDSGMSPYQARGRYTDRMGNQHTWEETRIFLVKSLVSVDENWVRE